MNESHPLVRHFMCFGLTYFFYDLYSMNRVFQAERKEAAEKNNQPFQEDIWAMVEARWIMVLHHILLPVIG